MKRDISLVVGVSDSRGGARPHREVRPLRSDTVPAYPIHAAERGRIATRAPLRSDTVPTYPIHAAERGRVATRAPLRSDMCDRIRARDRLTPEVGRRERQLR